VGSGVDPIGRIGFEMDVVVASIDRIGFPPIDAARGSGASMIVSSAPAPDGLQELERLHQHLLLGLGGVLEWSVVVSALFGRRCKGRKIAVIVGPL
jgi:hypothetical protein